MPPKKRRRVLPIVGQRNLFGVIASSATHTQGNITDSESTIKHRRGDVQSWRSFSIPRFKAKYPWLDVRENGVFCLYCSLNSSRSRKEVSKTFISEPFTGTRVNLLTKHSSTVIHEESTMAFRESQQRASQGRRIKSILENNQVTTIEGEAFCDAVKCMYFLVKREIPYTTNFSPLRDLCIQLGNNTLPLLDKTKNATFRSEQSMNEIVLAIGNVQENNLLLDVKKSCYFSVIVDESTDISVHKQLAISIQYMDYETASIKTRYLKLLWHVWTW